MKCAEDIFSERHLYWKLQNNTDSRTKQIKHWPGHELEDAILRYQFSSSWFTESIRPNKNPKRLFKNRMNKFIITSIWRTRRPIISKAILKKYCKLKGLTITDVTTHFGSIQIRQYAVHERIHK